MAVIAGSATRRSSPRPPTRPRPLPPRSLSSRGWLSSRGAPPAAPPPDPPTRPRRPLPSRSLSSRGWLSSRGAPPPAAPPPDLRPCPSRWPSSREGDPGRLEDVLTLVTGDGAQPTVLEAEEPVERSGRDEVRHLELPAELAGGSLLVALYELCHVGHVTHEVEHAHRPFRAAESQHHLVGGVLPRSLHRHLARLEEMRNGL